MKQGRHERILSLISQNEICTQEELAEFLRRDGFHVTQATVSRDIRQLNLTKIQGANGKSRYSAAVAGERQLGEKYVRVLKEGTVSIEEASNLLVIKTVSGMAMAVAAALDALKFPEVLGCIAGDDTIMCALKDVADAKTVHEKIDNLL